MTAKSKTSNVSRRKFITTSAAAGAGILGAPAILNAQNKGDKLRMAFIGVGGINKRHITAVSYTHLTLPTT